MTFSLRCSRSSVSVVHTLLLLEVLGDKGVIIKSFKIFNREHFLLFFVKLTMQTNNCILYS